MAELKTHFRTIGRAAPKVVREVLIQTADDIVAMAKELAPVDTGALRDSYMFSIEGPDRILVGSLANIINPNSKKAATEYAAYVEYGTSQNVAQPHFVPAFRTAQETFEARLRQALANLTR